jgi:hypothetical protein
MQDSFAPMIKGCVSYRTAGISDLKYTWLLYDIVGRNPAFPNVAMMLRISDGDLTSPQISLDRLLSWWGHCNIGQMILPNDIEIFSYVVLLETLEPGGVGR